MAWSTPHAGGKMDNNGNKGGTNDIRTGNEGQGPCMQTNNKQGIKTHGTGMA
jgi:hypothetical protein